MSTTSKSDCCHRALMLPCIAALAVLLSGCGASQAQSMSSEPTASMALSMLAASEASDTTTEGAAAESGSGVSESIEERMTSEDAEEIYKILVAEFAGRRGQLPLALTHYLDLARSTGNPELAERAVRVAVFARDEAGGLEAARLWAASAEPDHGARQVLGSLLLRADRLEEAISVLSAVVNELAESDPAIFERLAAMLAREKSRTSSVKVMEALIESYADNVSAQFALAQLLGRFGELDRALPVLDKVQAIDATHERAVVFAAQILARQKKHDLALERLSDFLEKTPEANTARLNYARGLVDAKRYDEARAEFLRLSETAPDDADIAYALGLLLLQTSDLDDAKVQFEKLINVPERRQVAWYYLGQIAESRNDSESALAAYRRVDRGEHHVDAQIRAAVLMSQKGEMAAARQHLHGLRARNRNDSVRIFRTEAELLARNELLEDALRVYSDALETFPKETGLLYARAMLAVKLDMVEQTEADLRDILTREPDNADAINALGYTLADRTDRYEEAYALIKRAVELKPNDHYVVDSLGWVLFRLGRHDEAIKYLREAFALKADPEVAAHLGEVLWISGDREGAKKVWDSALETQPDDKRLLEVIKRLTE
ncbi:MAG: tetratricopeptide (TPR) repeat protein [Gammaproteobacteria bacterium]|jgi:tetratricopeptide (TPR) repeat protein